MKKIIGSIFLVCFLSLSLSMSVQAKDDLRLFMVKANGASKNPIKLYRDPTTHSKVIRTIPRKATWLIEKSKPRIYSNVSWQKISWRGRRGWVLSKYIKYDSVSSALANKKSCRKKKENASGCKAS
ncbi:MAG TPA: hypothetical protein ENJ33_03080 [Thiothrix sp.]|nr:hypothetical protein [Thiothrix sp.]